MITLVNFADKGFRKKQKWNTFSAKLFGDFNQVFEFKPEDIDNDFLLKNKESLKYKAKGFGNYFWKPYIINKALKEVNDGDYLMYADSGSFFLKSILPLIKHMNEKKKNIMCFQLPLIEKQWTKRDAFLLMDCDKPFYVNSPQIMGGFILIKKCEESISFISNWGKYCADSRILSDDANTLKKENYKDFIEHRHDQSILSLLSKKNKNVLIEGDLSDYGYFPYKYIENIKRLYNKERLNIKNNTFKGTLVCNRSVSPIIYLIKYYIRRGFLFFGKKI